MEAKLIAYSLKHLSIAEQNQLRKKLNGHNDQSHGGKYQYRRKGLLDGVMHIKPSRSTIITPKEEANKIIQLLKKHKTKITSYTIQIAKTEFNK